MRRLGRRFFGLVAAVVVAASTLGTALPVFVQHVFAAACGPGIGIMFGRPESCGYFYDQFEDTGSDVRLGGVPAGVNTAQDFINLVEADYSSGNVQKGTEASFFIRTMIGLPKPTPPCALGTCKTRSAGEIAEFEDRVKSYASTSENGSRSTGPNGHIDWFHSDYLHCGDNNSYYQNTFHDVAPFVMDRGNTPECNNTSIRFDHIEFFDASGALLFKIRRLCMNTIGTLRPLAAAPLQYNLTANITATSGGSPLVSGSYVQAGDPVNFSYDVNNTQAGTATGIACQAHANNFSGWRSVPAPPQTTGPTPSGVTCSGTYGPGNTHLGTETIASAPNDTSICRSLIVSPKSPAGGQSAREVCVYVSSRPYFRVYGGDVSAGNPQSNACATATRAGIVSWTKNLASHAGAATRYAALALDKIYDFSTTLGNGAGAAPAPSGLAFANTAASGDHYGGNFGSLPCMTDYYASKSGGVLASPIDIGAAAVATGTYMVNGPVSISGSMGSNIKRVVIYVNGNVTITGNISYPTVGWTTGGAAGMPLLEIIASGSIFIDHSVTNVDGLYVAQANGTAGSGTIYTCTNGSTQYTVNATGSFNAPCSSKLAINGSFVANQVQLLRTAGTVGQANSAEGSGVNQAEVFNYSPALWMSQPPNAPATANYDSITSLPPIL